MIPRKARLSLALIVKNEARCLARCLTSVREIVDEMIVVDTGSTDDTVRIAQQFGAKTFVFNWVDDFAAARNHSLDRTSGDWILVLDADEQASDALRKEIAGFVQAQPAVGRLRIVSDFRRKDQLLRSQTFVPRLFPRGARFEGRIHEQLISPWPSQNLRAELRHDGYLEVQKSDRNVRLLRRELARSPENAYYRFQLAIEYVSLNQTAQAFECLRKAFALVGPEAPFAPNLVVDYLYTIQELKHFEIGLEVIQKTSAWLEDFPDFHLACGLFYMQLVRANPEKYFSYLAAIEGCFKHCLSVGETDKYKSVSGTGSFLAHYNLGILYHVFGDEAAARGCFQSAASFGYAPAETMLKTLEK